MNLWIGTFISGQRETHTSPRKTNKILELHFNSQIYFLVFPTFGPLIDIPVIETNLCSDTEPTITMVIGAHGLMVGDFFAWGEIGRVCTPGTVIC